MIRLAMAGRQQKELGSELSIRGTWFYEAPCGVVLCQRCRCRLTVALSAGGTAGKCCSAPTVAGVETIWFLFQE